MRHAKSDWSGGTTDHARILNARGRRAAPAVALGLANRAWHPEGVWSSDSARTAETWQLMAAHLPDSVVQFTPQLYLAESASVLDLVARVPAEVGTAMILAHNPGISEAVERACGEAVVLRTADAALLEQDGHDWSAAAGRKWRLVELIRGREAAP